MNRNPDWLLNQLPGGLHDDDFLMRYLRIFQDMGDTFLDTLDGLELAFDASVPPTSMVRVLGSWIGLEYLDEELPDEVQRSLVREYSTLVAWRGTRYGLERLLAAITGAGVIVRDDAAAYFVPQPAINEWEPAPAGIRSHVFVAVPEGGWASDDDLLRIVQRELPATVTFEMRRGPRTLWPLSESRVA